jgi:glutathione S-transferase
MEQHLAAQSYFAGDHCAIAAICLYTCTQVVTEVGYDLGNL